MDRQLKVGLESSVTLVAPEGSKARLLLEKYGRSRHSECHPLSGRHRTDEYPLYE